MISKNFDKALKNIMVNYEKKSKQVMEEYDEKLKKAMEEYAERNKELNELFDKVNDAFCVTHPDADKHVEALDEITNKMNDPANRVECTQLLSELLSSMQDSNSNSENKSFR